MSLASPDKLIWLLAALPVIVFYILKTRLRRRPVSTLLFWDQIFEQKRQRSLWQNLRHWLSLLLQLAFVLLIGFALADPLWKSQTDTGQDMILVVDNSASMAALDGSGRTRLDRAIERANDVAGTLRNGDNIALVTAGTSVKVRVGMSDFAPTVQEALTEIEPTDGPTKIDEAIAAARRLAADASKRRIVVFSDGCVEDRDDPASEDDLSWVRVGESQDNIAITTFQVRRSTVDPIGYSLLLEIHNYGEEDAETRLTLMLDEALVDVVPITIAAGESFRTQIDGTSQAGGVLLGEIDVEDALEVDNQARAVLPERPEIPVRLIVGEDTESYYLERVLESLPLVRVLEADSDEQPSLIVISGVVPESIPEGPVLIADVAGSGPRIGRRRDCGTGLGSGGRDRKSDHRKARAVIALDAACSITKCHPRGRQRPRSERVARRGNDLARDRERRASLRFGRTTARPDLDAGLRFGHQRSSAADRLSRHDDQCDELVLSGDGRDQTGARDREGDGCRLGHRGREKARRDRDVDRPRGRRNARHV